MDLHLEKMTEQTQYIVQHLRNGDSLGRQIKISLETTQLEAVTNEPRKEGEIGKTKVYHAHCANGTDMRIMEPKNRDMDQTLVALKRNDDHRRREARLTR